MKKRNLLCVTLLILLTAVSGCNNKRNSNEDQDGIEIENPSMEDGLDVSEISENSYAYFDNLEGEWMIAEYVGAITDSHSEEMTAPYIGVKVGFKDKEEQYDFIIDSNGIVLVEIDYHFFRLERKTFSGNDTEAFENMQQYYNTITDDDLNALETYPSHNSYWNDSLVM